MGGYFENILLVVSRDVIHVLKIQAVLYVMHEFAPVEEVYAVRTIVQQDACQVLTLSSTATCNLRIFSMVDASHQASPLAKHLSITLRTSDISAHVSSMETVTNDAMQRYFVVLAWSTGVVDVYDVLREKHCVELQDKRLAERISALSAVTYQRVTKHKGLLALAHQTLIVVGTESGKLYGWKIKALWDDDLTFQRIQTANVWVQTAHSSYVTQLSRISATVRGECAWLSSVSAHGVVKLWRVPLPKMFGFVNSAMEGNPGTPSCMELMRGHKLTTGAGDQNVDDLCVIVGYEDGQLAVWRIAVNQASFQQLDVSTKHERRVSRICRISSDVDPARPTGFLSSSLDMTVIQ